MNPEEQERAFQLGRTWDDFVSGKRTGNADADLLAEIQFAQEIAAVPAAAPDLRARIWQQVNGRSLPSSISSASVAPRSNGVANEVIAPNRMNRPARAWSTVWLGIYRLLAIAVIAGFSAGLLTGLWTRLAMRIAGELTADRNRGLLTENDAVVGELTIDGTISLALTGAFAGLVGGLLYIAIRRWLPAHPGLRAIGFGGLLFAVFGFIVMDEHNPDYQRFGPVWLNMGTFSLSYLIFGVLASVFVEGLDRSVPVPQARPGSATGKRWLDLALIPFAGIGLLTIVATMLIGVGAMSARLMVALILFPVAWRLAPRLSLGIDPRSPAFATIGLCAVLLPSLFGLFLTLQGIVGILAG
ncbi:MAG: hypothetical protein M3457_11210 [Chloroflexota bacterium]|nr:hypothetical protein [Chloroflexota bacterium]